MADQKSLLVKLAHIFYQTGSWEKALIEYEKILALDPLDSNVRATVAEIQLKRGQLEKAYAEYELAVAGFLREKNTRKAAGCFREMAGIVQKHMEPQDQEKAERLYKAILEKMPDCVEALQNLRDLYVRHNQTDDAVKFTLRLGDMFNKLDYIDKAEKEYRTASNLDPSNPEAREKLDKIKNELMGNGAPGETP